LADAVLTEEEKQFMIQLWHALDIPDEIGEKIIDVMNIKNFMWKLRESRWDKGPPAAGRRGLRAAVPATLPHKRRSE
jgi:hypothetical protein